MTGRRLSTLGALGLAIAMLTAPSWAAPEVQLSGAIFTSDVTGAPVNLNIYDDKGDVYLNGGPGASAPQEAAGLPAGDYYFQVTDPSGKTLLSQDEVECRVVTVDAEGTFAGVGNSDQTCEHATGTDTEQGGATVQLMPYADTPNRGGVYKVWITPVGYLDCDAPGNKNCFVPRYSKVDNFKVRTQGGAEIDTRFEKGGQYVDGLAAHWTDTLGAHNVKYSEWKPALLAFHEAHVEAVEPGVHTITVFNQDECIIDHVHTPGGETLYPVGGQVSVDVRVSYPRSSSTIKTYWVDVSCT